MKGSSTVTLKVSKTADATAYPLLLSFPQSISTTSLDTVVPVDCSYRSNNNNSLGSSSSGIIAGKRKQTCVETDMNGFIVRGKNFDDKTGDIYNNDTCYFAVGSLNEDSGEMTLRVTDHAFVMKPEIESNNAISRTFASYYERKQVLTEEFGSKKKKRAMQAAQSNHISEENIAGARAVEQSMIATYEKADFEKTSVTAAELAIELNRQDTLPKYNTETDRLTEVYPLFGVMPVYILGGLDQYIFANELTDRNGISSLQLLKSKLEQSSSSSDSTSASRTSSIFSTISNMIESDNSVHKRAINLKIIIFTNYLLKFLLALNSSNDKMILKSDLALISDAKEDIYIYIVDNFTCYQRKYNGKPSYTSSKGLIDKFFMHIIVLVLHSCNFQCSISRLAQDTKLTDNTLSNIARALGCNIVKRPSDSFPHGDVTAVLSAPLIFPKMKRSKKL